MNIKIVDGREFVEYKEFRDEKITQLLHEEFLQEFHRFTYYRFLNRIEGMRFELSLLNKVRKHLLSGTVALSLDVA